MAKPVTRDCDIRIVLLRELRKQFPHPADDLILQEFRCNGSRIDVAVINGSLHGYEIKSDSDSTFRLSKQVVDYSGVFDFVTLVCGRTLLRSARVIAPEWWGINLAIFDGSKVEVTEIRKPQQNPNQTPEALARMLWKPEVLYCLRRNGHTTVTSRSSVQQIRKEAALRLDVKTLADAARQAIKARGVYESGMQSVPDDDSCTIESTGLADHCSENLAWLLSQLSPYPQS